MERTELKALIPNGYQKIIAKRAKVNQSTVSNFFNGKSDSMAIEIAALEVIAELQEKKAALILKIKATA